MIFTKFRNNARYRVVYEALCFVIGCVCYSAGVALFITPGNISVGGFTGISIIISRLFSFPVGTVILVMNIPMFIICARKFGIKFIVKTILGVVATSFLIDGLSYFQLFDLSHELYALFGGILQGLGLGILYHSGFTTGGTDLIIWLIRLRYPYFSTGFILFILDAVVVMTSALITGDISSVLYSVITIFSYTKVIDTIMGSSGRGSLAIVISTSPAAVADSIQNTLGRGVTVVDGKGWYTKESKTVILCVVERSQIYVLKNITAAADPDAFVIMTDASEVIGRGFKPLKG